MSDFETSLIAGQETEMQVLKEIRKKYPSASLINAFKGYDIWIPETKQSVEVKFDNKSNQTGNIVIEFEMNGKRSALMTTTATYWVITDGNVLAWFTPMDIVYCIFENNLKYAEFVGKGDTASKKAYLIKKDLLFKYAIKITKIE